MHSDTRRIDAFGVWELDDAFNDQAHCWLSRNDDLVLGMTVKGLFHFHASRLESPDTQHNSAVYQLAVPHLPGLWSGTTDTVASQGEYGTYNEDWPRKSESFRPRHDMYGVGNKGSGDEP
jgi:hypothetical protein